MRDCDASAAFWFGLAGRPGVALRGTVEVTDGLACVQALALPTLGSIQLSDVHGDQLFVPDFFGQSTTPFTGC